MGELFQGQDGSLWRSVGPLEVGLGFMGLGQTMAGQYRADHSPWLKASVPCKWSQVEASGLPHHIIPTLFHISSANVSGFDFSPKNMFSKKNKK